MTGAFGPDLMQSRALASWSAALLGNPHMMIVGATCDVDVINGLDHLRSQGALRHGGVIGHIHLRGDYGENALRRPADHRPARHARPARRRHRQRDRGVGVRTAV